jgi:hypothetical protein
MDIDTAKAITGFDTEDSIAAEDGWNVGPVHEGTVARRVVRSAQDDQAAGELNQARAALRDDAIQREAQQAARIYIALMFNNREERR